MGHAGNEKTHGNNSGHAKATMQHGSWGKHIIRSFVRDGREHQYHATKGWRSYKIQGKK